MPTGKTPPVNKANRSEVTTKSARGKGQTPDEAGNTYKHTTKAAQFTPNPKPVKSEATNDLQKTMAAQFTPNPNYSVKSEAVNDLQKSKAAQFTPYPKTVKSKATNDLHKTMAAQFTPNPNYSVKSEAVNDLQKSKAAQFTPYPKPVKSEATNDLQKSKAAQFTPYPKTVKSEAINDLQKTGAAQFTPNPNYSAKSDAVNDLQKSRAAQFTPHPTTMKLKATKEGPTVSIETSMKTLQIESRRSVTNVGNGSPRQKGNSCITVDETGTGDQDDSETGDSKVRVYKDNQFNRKHIRVGKVIGSAVYSRKTKSISQRTYIDNTLNRRRGCVGKPRGSMPVQKSSITKRIPEILEKIINDELEAFTIDYEITMTQSDKCQGAPSIITSDETMVEAFDQAICRYNREQIELSWQRQSEMPDRRPKTLQGILEDYTEKKIPSSDLKLSKRIGQGGFGNVYFGHYFDSVVAVKKLKKAELSQKDINNFAKEVLTFCSLKHPNIVKFIGVCTEVPNICIVMEYMQMTLYDAIHVRNDVDFTDTERTSVVKQTCNGVKYLHASRIAHCDLKSLNILLNYDETDLWQVKITDFGLSMVKPHTFDKSDCSEVVVRNAGTPRYSAPEVLRGEMLDAREMMKADVYSLSLVILEVLFEQEPFPTYNRQKLKEQIGHQGEEPEISDWLAIDHKVKSIIQRAYSFTPAARPDIAEICDVFRQKQNIYDAEEIALNIFS